jgi:hypothetical protein
MTPSFISRLRDVICRCTEVGFFIFRVHSALAGGPVRFLLFGNTTSVSILVLKRFFGD